MEHKLEISSVDDMNIRVIRSSTAMIELPEFEIKIEPGSASEAYISNIEGVLVRISDVIEQADRFTENNEKNLKVKELLTRIEELRKGIGRATLILSDPMGNSAIISDKTKSRELGPDEIKVLETGLTVFEVSGVDDKL
jgi:zinc finger protein